MTGPNLRDTDPDVAAPVSASLAARVARTAADIEGALALRGAVFVQEMGARASAETPALQERDRFDAHAVHLIVEDMTRPVGARIVGTSRVLGMEGAAKVGGFYSADEFDLAPLLDSDHRLLELGRTCLHRAYRGGAAMVVLWQALSDLVTARGATLLFGTASFPGTDPMCHAAALDLLHRDHLAAPDLRVVSQQGGWQRGMGAEGRLAAMRSTPALIKSYLRLGGVIGDGVFVDHAFNTTDVCMILEARALKGAAARLYAGRARAVPTDG